MSTTLKQENKATPKESKPTTGSSQKSKSATKPNAGGKARLEARIHYDAHIQIKRAAEIQGRTVTDFVICAAVEAAQKTIEDTSIIRLSLADQELFANALITPPEPYDALRRAFAKQAELFGGKK